MPSAFAIFAPSAIMPMVKAIDRSGARGARPDPESRLRKSITGPPNPPSTSMTRVQIDMACDNSGFRSARQNSGRAPPSNRQQINARGLDKPSPHRSNAAPGEGMARHDGEARKKSRARKMGFLDRSGRHLHGYRCQHA